MFDCFHDIFTKHIYEVVKLVIHVGVSAGKGVERRRRWSAGSLKRFDAHALLHGF